MQLWWGSAVIWISKTWFQVYSHDEVLALFLSRPTDRNWNWDLQSCHQDDRFVAWEKLQLHHLISKRFTELLAYCLSNNKAAAPCDHNKSLSPWVTEAAVVVRQSPRLAASAENLPGPGGSHRSGGSHGWSGAANTWTNGPVCWPVAKHPPIWFC